MKRIILLLALLAFCTGCPPAQKEEKPRPFKEGQTVYFRFAATKVVVNDEGKGEVIKYHKEAVITDLLGFDYVNVRYWDDEGELHEDMVEAHELMSKEEAE
jgi:hypothetical protein